jgi:hypothetical protein
MLKAKAMFKAKTMLEVNIMLKHRVFWLTFNSLTSTPMGEVDVSSID